MLAITTPTGNIGSRVAENLLKTDEPLILLARTPEKLPEDFRKKAVIKQGSTDDAEFMKAATVGARALFLCVPPVFQAKILRETIFNFVRAAVSAIEENKIETVVFVSSGGKGVKNAGSISILHEAEKMLGETKANVAFLRAGFFMENFLNFLPTILQAGKVFAPASGELVLPMVAAKDIAAIAAELLKKGDWRGEKIVPIHGAADLSLNEAMKILGAGIGKELEFVTVPEFLFEQGLLKIGASPDVVHETLNLYRAFAGGSIYENEPRTAESTTTTTLDEWTRESFAPAFKTQLLSQNE